MNIWVKGILGTYAVGILYVRYVLKTELRQAEKQKGGREKDGWSTYIINSSCREQVDHRLVRTRGRKPAVSEKVTTFRNYTKVMYIFPPKLEIIIKKVKISPFHPVVNRSFRLLTSYPEHFIPSVISIMATN